MYYYWFLLAIIACAIFSLVASMKVKGSFAKRKSNPKPPKELDFRKSDVGSILVRLAVDLHLVELNAVAARVGGADQQRCPAL